MDRFTAFLDANVIYPAGLRDMLLRLADRNLYRACWSAMVHEEWMQNVLNDRSDLSFDRLQRTRETMDRHFPDALVVGFEPLIDGLSLPDPDDRHVLAAAIRGRADVIVTKNLKDFPRERLDPYGIEARHPDDFDLSLFGLYQDAVLEAVRDHRAALRQPPRTPEKHLEAYESMGMTKFSSALQDHLAERGAAKAGGAGADKTPDALADSGTP